MFFKHKKAKKEAPAEVDIALLGEHFYSIRITILEIRNFKEKIILPTPTHKVRKKIDIEEAWPNCRNLFIEIFNILNEVGERFQVEQGGFYENSLFTEALDAFLDQLATILFGIADALGTGRYTDQELIDIDARILQIQHGANRLLKYVKTDFTYSA
ncbi:hypothetical protein P4E94_03750 [Pontiellaceae bacterium B12219]|nr:hypothetical protein [Pontiellaceae bacterium B12219]